MSLKPLKSRYLATIPALAIVLIIAMMGVPSAANTAANTLTGSPEYTLSITGVGTVSVDPDQAMVSLGVMIQATKASDAVAMNAEKMSDVVTALQKLDLSEDDIQTSWYSLYPIYEWDEERRTQILVGYQATNTITVTTSDLTLIGTIIDDATAAGANQVNSITFKVSDEIESQLEEEAYKKACADAKAKADIIAEALNVKIVGVKSISTSSAGPIYPRPVTYEAKAGFDTPIFPGESEVTTTVYVEFLIQNLTSSEITNMTGARTIEANVGQEFTITLESNPSTGYQWQLAKALDEGIVKLVGTKYKASETGLIGAGGTEVWTFKAVGDGTTEISLMYMRPWESVPPLKEEVFFITVK